MRSASLARSLRCLALIVAASPLASAASAETAGVAVAKSAYATFVDLCGAFVTDPAGFLGSVPNIPGAAQSQSEDGSILAVNFARKLVDGTISDISLRIAATAPGRWVSECNVSVWHDAINSQSAGAIFTQAVEGVAGLVRRGGAMPFLPRGGQGVAEDDLDTDIPQFLYILAGWLPDDQKQEMWVETGDSGLDLWVIRTVAGTQ